MSSPPICFFFFLLLLLLLLLGPIPSLCRSPHVINFRSPNLYPEGIAYDPSAQHFLVGSFRHRTISSVSDAGVIETFISDHSLPVNSTILGITVDSVHHRLLACVTSLRPQPPFNALAAYDLRTRSRIFLASLPSAGPSAVANAVTVDFKGNAYVTNSGENFIWKVSMDGEATVFSKSPMFTRYEFDPNAPFSFCGLNGIAYVSKGYLLVVQSNTGKMFKVDVEDGTARTVLLPKDMVVPDGVAVRRDGVVSVVSPTKLWFLKSDNSWGEGVIYDEIELDEERFPTSVTVGREDRVYAIYGCVYDAIVGKEGRDWFAIEEVRSKKESEDEKVWVYVLVGLGLAYFLFWRFQMKQLVKNLDKKTS